MKKILLLILLLFAQLSFAQEIEEVEVEEEVENQEVPFSIIENVPVYEGCQDLANNDEKKKCFDESISKHVSKKFNRDLVDNLDLNPGLVRMFAIFKVDEKGYVVDVRARAPHPELQEETLRVMRLIPKMHAPGTQRGKPVVVTYALPITFTVVGNLAPEEEQSYPLTPDEIKALKKKKKQREKELKKALKEKEKEEKNKD
ncbi:energy transducer TonB [Olleya sp. YS]|uniref:energy transducer TonB n=1 Tax=Olleya sp. YS TaxID=3028318 RepID=UPI002434687C|nr:energy transducer TonB [Olleya sp. YS]WGD33618.1 energy transducer TonB [Olleya sp. YS]